MSNNNVHNLEPGFTLSEASIQPPHRVIQESDANVTYTSSPKIDHKKTFGSANNSPSSSIGCLKKTTMLSTPDLSRLSFPTPQYLCSCGCLQKFGEGCAFAKSKTTMNR